MPTSRPIRRGEWLTDIRSGSPFLGANDRASGLENPDGYVLQSDFELEHLGGDKYWRTMRERVFGISDDGDVDIALANRTAPGLYVREGDDTSNWEEYRQVLARRVAEATGGANAAQSLAEIGITPPLTPTPTTTPPPPPPPPPPPTRFNLLECDLPAVDPTPAKQKHFDALAELQASFRAAKVAAKTAVQPVLTRFDLLECDEPAVPVTVRPKWSAPPSAPPQRPQSQPQPPQPERRTVEDILDLTTRGPLEALAALQVAKAEILRELRQRETN